MNSQTVSARARLMTAWRSKGEPWRGRIVVVTGGTSGIGRAFVVRLAAEGAKVIACARNEMALRELETRYPAIEVFRCDVTARMDVLALQAAIRDRHGRIDVLINNAGIMEQLDLLDGSVGDERIAQEIAVNLTGPILLTRTLLPLLRFSRSALIIVITSGYALLPVNPRSDLLREQGRTPLLYDGIATAVAQYRHPGHRSAATAGRYAGDAFRAEI